MKRRHLLKEVSEILDYDLTKLVATESGYFVTSLSIDKIRELSLPKHLPKQKHCCKIAILFNWMNMDALEIEEINSKITK